MIQTLRNFGFNTENILEKSGHQNVSSVLNYSVVTDEEQKKMSEVLMEARHVPQNSANERCLEERPERRWLEECRNPS